MRRRRCSQSEASNPQAPRATVGNSLMRHGHPIPMRGGDEHDAFTGWRRVLRFRPGERTRIKRGYWKRARQAVKTTEQ